MNKINAKVQNIGRSKINIFGRVWALSYTAHETYIYAMKAELIHGYTPVFEMLTNKSFFLCTQKSS